MSQKKQIGAEDLLKGLPNIKIIKTIDTMKNKIKSRIENAIWHNEQNGGNIVSCNVNLESKKLDYNFKGNVLLSVDPKSIQDSFGGMSIVENSFGGKSIELCLIDGFSGIPFLSYKDDFINFNSFIENSIFLCNHFNAKILYETNELYIVYDKFKELNAINLLQKRPKVFRISERIRDIDDYLPIDKKIYSMQNLIKLSFDWYMNLYCEKIAFNNLLYGYGQQTALVLASINYMFCNKND